MTREEAIEFGNMWLQINEDCKDSNTYTFFQMALKALEQEPALDKVRAEIIEMISNRGFLSCGTNTIANDINAVFNKYKADIEPQESEDKE